MNAESGIEKMSKLETALCLLRKESKILLAKKKEVLEKENTMV